MHPKLDSYCASELLEWSMRTKSSFLMILWKLFVQLSTYWRERIKNLQRNIFNPSFNILTREDKRHLSERGKFAENAWESVPSLQGFEPTAQDGTSYTSRLIKLWSFARSGLQFVNAILYLSPSQWKDIIIYIYTIICDIHSICVPSRCLFCIGGVWSLTVLKSQLHFPFLSFEFW